MENDKIKDSEQIMRRSFLDKDNNNMSISEENELDMQLNQIRNVACVAWINLRISYV
jgi:hypothetical protein